MATPAADWAAVDSNTTCGCERRRVLAGSLTILNAGYVLVPDADIGGLRLSRQDIWRASAAQEWRIAKKTTLLSEVYWRSKR